jgi:hypothetical protein
MLRTYHGSLAVLIVLSTVFPALAASDEVPPHQSKALDEGFKSLGEDMLDFMARNGANGLPAGAQARSKLGEEIIRQMEKSSPGLRTVTKGEADDFGHGKFDDAGNMARINDMVAAAGQNKMELPGTVEFVVDASKAKMLKGAELEAGRRFMEAFMNSRLVKKNGG